MTPRPIALLLAAVLLLGAPAAAQEGALSDAPIEISADAADIDQLKRVAVLSGGVVAEQGPLRIEADKVTVYYAEGGGSAAGLEGQIERLEASGHVKVTRPGEEVRSSAATYRMKERAILMSGGVVAVRGKNVVKGDKLTIDLAREIIKLDASAGGGRVKGLFTPEKTGEGDSGAKP